MFRRGKEASRSEHSFTPVVTVEPVLTVVMVTVLPFLMVAVLPDSYSISVLQAVAHAARLSQKSNDKQNGETKIEPDRSQ